MARSDGGLATGGNFEKKYCSPTSSGAAKHTFFIQAVAFDSGTRMTQPHTLNHLNLHIEDSNIGVDHPSAQITIQLPGRIEGRDYKKVAPNLQGDTVGADEENEEYNLCLN